MMNLSHVFKANPYRDEKGRFSTGGGPFFHGTSVADLISKEGFKVLPGGNGRLLGDGIYITPSKTDAASYGGEVLEVDASAVKKVKEFVSEPAYKKWLAKSGLEDFTPASITTFMQGKGFEAVLVAEKSLVVFDASKLTVKGKAEKAEGQWFMAVKRPAKKSDFSFVFRVDKRK